MIPLLLFAGFGSAADRLKAGATQGPCGRPRRIARSPPINNGPSPLSPLGRLHSRGDAWLAGGTPPSKILPNPSPSRTSPSQTRPASRRRDGSEPRH